jgi:hypothetical protein
MNRRLTIAAVTIGAVRAARRSADVVHAVSQRNATRAAHDRAASPTAPRSMI